MLPTLSISTRSLAALTLLLASAAPPASAHSTSSPIYAAGLGTTASGRGAQASFTSYAAIPATSSGWNNQEWSSAPASSYSKSWQGSGNGGYASNWNQYSPNSGWNDASSQTELSTGVKPYSSWNSDRSIGPSTYSKGYSSGWNNVPNPSVWKSGWNSGSNGWNGASNTWNGGSTNGWKGGSNSWNGGSVNGWNGGSTNSWKGGSNGWNGGSVNGWNGGSTNGWNGGSTNGWTGGSNGWNGGSNGWNGGSTNGWNGGSTNGWNGGSTNGWNGGSTNGWNGGSTNGWNGGSTNGWTGGSNGWNGGSTNGWNGGSYGWNSGSNVGISGWNSSPGTSYSKGWSNSKLYSSTWDTSNAGFPMNSAYWPTATPSVSAYEVVIPSHESATGESTGWYPASNNANAWGSTGLGSDWYR